MSVNVINAEKRRCLRNCFFNVIRNTNMSYEDAVKVVAKAPAPQFYVSYESARRFVSLLDRGHDIPVRNPLKRALYKELYKRFKERGIVTKGRYLILEEIIKESAPSYYMTEDGIRNHIYMR